MKVRKKPQRSEYNGGSIYFVTDGEAIKIGYARDVHARVKGLQTSHYFPLFLIGYLPASPRDEGVLHRRFEHLKLVGEWFRIDPELTGYIDDQDDAGKLIEGDEMEDYDLKLARLNRRSR